VLYGRAEEQSVIAGLLTGAQEGRSAALVIRGEPGIGKTALLDFAATVACAAGFQVIRGTGVECEAELSFAGLHVLLGPVLGKLPSLPEPQRDALAAAFGLQRPGSRDRFLVGLAVLSLLAELAEEGPLLCLVDDAHWLDRASAEALVFAARRLGAEGIAVILAARGHDQPFPAPGLPVLRLGGLGEDPAAALLGAQAPGLPPELRCRVLAEAQGNPLGLIELAAVYCSHAPAGGPGGDGPLLTDRLRQAFEGQVRRLPEDTQTMLLVAAAEGSGDLPVLLDAASALGVAPTAMSPAEQARMISLAGNTVSFRHPLVRAAVYQSATMSQRLAVHRALAGAPRSLADADRRAWHLAAAATGPNEEVAAELERTAGEARARGGYAAAAAALERAVQLTIDPMAKTGRLTSAAEARAEIGDFDHARNLAVRAAAQTTDPIVAARLANVRARADVAQGRLPAAHRQLVDGAAQIASLDPPRAARMLMYAMHVAWLPGNRRLVTDTADRLKMSDGSLAEPLAPIIQLMLRVAGQAAGRLSEDQPRIAELLAQAQRTREGNPYDLTMVAMVALVTGRTGEARDMLGALIADARSQGTIGWLPTLLCCLAQALLFDGRYSDALACAAEALRIAQDTGQPQWASELNGIMAYLAAVEGDEDRCRTLADEALAEPVNDIASAAKPWVHWALGLLDLGHGRLDTALVRLETIWHGPARYHASALRSITDLVEAGVRLGQPERVTEPMGAFLAWARCADVPGINALADRCRALVACDDPERHYLAALQQHDESFEQARTQLLYGAWLRRSRRKAEARTPLRAAVGYLDRIGAVPWAEQARAELSATGVTAPGPDRTSLPRLTPQELQVARLAAQGLSNRDIAAQLFLSPRTVGYHLYKAYPKLGVTSRSELDPQALSRGLLSAGAKPHLIYPGSRVYRHRPDLEVFFSQRILGAGEPGRRQVTDVPSAGPRGAAKGTRPPGSGNGHLSAASPPPPRRQRTVPRHGLFFGRCIFLRRLDSTRDIAATRQRPVVIAAHPALLP
jgi:DNA-binding CsgD family transcriptional regulator